MGPSLVASEALRECLAAFPDPPVCSGLTHRGWRGRKSKNKTGFSSRPSGSSAFGQSWGCTAAGSVFGYQCFFWLSVLSWTLELWRPWFPPRWFRGSGYWVFFPVQSPSMTVVSWVCSGVGRRLGFGPPGRFKWCHVAYLGHGFAVPHYGHLQRSRGFHRQWPGTLTTCCEGGD